MPGADAGGAALAAGVTEPRPVWRGWLHVAAFVAALPGGALLVHAAGTAAAVVGVAVYTTGLVLCFGTSAAYHRLARSAGARRVMQRADHSMIYVLIASTYTPICLLALPRRWGVPLLVAVWFGSAVGIVLKTFALGRHRLLELGLYPALGWCVLAVAPVLVDHLTTAELLLVVAGGVLYTVGVPVLALRRPDPWPRLFGYHEVWHGFTVAAAACHFGAVSLLVV